MVNEKKVEKNKESKIENVRHKAPCNSPFNLKDVFNKMA